MASCRSRPVAATAIPAAPSTHSTAIAIRRIIRSRRARYLADCGALHLSLSARAASRAAARRPSPLAGQQRELDAGEGAVTRAREHGRHRRHADGDAVTLAEVQQRGATRAGLAE